MLRLRATTLPLVILAAAIAAGGVGWAAGQRFGPSDGYLAGVGFAAVLAGGVVALAAGPAPTICVGLVLSLFSGHFPDLGIPVGLDRVVLVGGILLAVWREIRSDHSLLRTRWVHVLLALVVLYTVLSTYYGGRMRDNDAFFGLLDYLGIIPFALFWLAPAVFPTQRERRMLLATLVGIGLYLGFTALVETTGPAAFVFPSYISNPAVGLHYGRARGPFTEAAGNGLALCLCGFASAVAFTQWRRFRSIAAVAVVLCALGVLFTLTRQIWLAATIGTIVALAADRRLRPLLIPTFAVGAIVVVAVFFFVPGFSGRAQGRLDSQRPVWDRLNSNAATVRMTEERPLVGFGWYSFSSVSAGYYELAPDRELTTVGRPHNVFLALAGELGLVCAAAWLISLLIAIGGGLRRRGPPDLDAWRMGLVGAFCAWLVVANFTPMSYAFDHSLLWLWAGLGWSRK